jgi:CRP/FNR family cyclic AMP-dependent transcriptional regulator
MARDTRGASLGELGGSTNLLEERVQIQRWIRAVISIDKHPVRMATATTMAPTAAVEITKGEMIRILHKQNEFADRFISYMLKRNVRIEADLVDQLFNSTEKRLARALLLLARYGKEGQPEPIVGKISQETLAELAGATRSRVNVFMNKFRELGFIHYNGGLQVHSSLLNVVLHD